MLHLLEVTVRTVRTKSGISTLVAFTKHAALGCLTACLTLLGACSTEVEMVGSNQQTDLVLTEENAAAKLPDPSPEPVAATSPKPIPSIVPMPAPTQTVTLPVETSTTKPVTNLYLIVDNSNSMGPVQQRAATAISALMSSIASQDLNLNIHLLSTTDFASATPPAATINYGGRTSTISLPSIIPGAEGVKGNSSFAKRTITESIINPGEFTIEDTVQQRASHFQGGVIQLREGMPAATAASLTTSAYRDINSFGTSGSQTEQPVAAIYRVAATLPVNSSERHAFAIITNEDDLTQRSLVIGHRSVIGSTDYSTLRFFYENTRISYEYEHYRAATYNDGIMTMPEAWIKTTLNQLESNCATNGNCLATGSAPTGCNPAQLSLMQSRVTTMGSSQARLIPNAACTVSIDQTYAQSTITGTIDADCSTIKPGTAITYEQDFKDRNSGLRYRTPACTKMNLPPFYRKSTSRITIDDLNTSPSSNNNAVGTGEIGARAINLLTQKAGAKGFTVALIANNGTDSCGQSAFADATRLGQFLVAAVGAASAPNLRNSVCASEYTAITNGLRTFISEAAKLEYPFAGTLAQIVRIDVVDAGGTLLRTLVPADYTVSAGKIIFRSGSLAIGEKIKIIRYQP